MIISDSGSSYEQLEEGLHPAVSILIAGVGTQRTPFKNEDGTDKVQKKMIIQWETKDGLIAKEYTVSLNEKANLRKDLESWRGKKFSPTELEGFDMTNLLGVQCTLQIMHNDNGYAKVNTVLPKTQELKKTKSTNIYDITDHDQESFELLPNWVKQKIEQSIEWQQAKKTGEDEKKMSQKEALEAFSDGSPVLDTDEPIDLKDIPF